MLEGINWWIVVKAVLISTFICVILYETQVVVLKRRDRERIIAEAAANLDDEIAQLLEAH